MNNFKFQVSGFKFQVIAISILLVLSITVQAQDSLSVYLELAGKNNPGLQAKYLEYSAALEKVPQAGALPDPTAQLGFFLKPMELLGGNQLSSIQVMQMFPWFGALKVAKDEASQMALMKFEEARDNRNLLYSQVKTSWYQIYQKKKEIAILKENLELLHTLEQIALSKYTNAKVSGSSGGPSSGNTAPTQSSANSGGMGGMKGGNTNQTAPASSGGMAMSGGSSAMGSKGSGMVDVLRVQMEIAELENRVALSEDLLGTEIARFNNLLNRSSKLPVMVPDSLQPVALAVDLNALSDSLRNNPMLQMSLAQRAAGQAQQQMANKMGKPMVGIGANYMLIEKRAGNAAMMNGKDMIMPMVSFTIPFFSKKYKSMEREAGFKIEASEKSYENTSNNLKISFLDLVQQYKDADRRLSLYQKQAALARTSVKLLTTSFSASESDFEEVLRMQAQLLDYGLKELAALTDYNMTVAQLEYLAGIE
ncbi:MAG: TolC family protein [Prolixibacteraceae bacterium]|jgi:outer membrane protein TolC